MAKKDQLGSEKKSNVKVGTPRSHKDEPAAAPDARPSGIEELQQTVGNKAVQRLLAQRDGDGAYDLDDETADRINQARGAGQPLTESVQKSMGTAMGEDFSHVRTHTSSEADQLNRQLGAQAFTTGQDIFFGEGQYRPDELAGQELLAHELTHVVQQSHGMPDSGPGMQVNPPGDAYEQEADKVAKAISDQDEDTVQRQEMPEEEELLQSQPLEEEEEMLQPQRLQAQPVEEEEEMLQPQRLQAQPVEEEELMQPQRLQAQPVEEEELLQGQRVQRHDEKGSITG